MRAWTRVVFLPVLMVLWGPASMAHPDPWFLVRERKLRMTELLAEGWPRLSAGLSITLTGSVLCSGGHAGDHASLEQHTAASRKCMTTARHTHPTLQPHDVSAGWLPMAHSGWKRLWTHSTPGTCFPGPGRLWLLRAV